MRIVPIGKWMAKLRDLIAEHSDVCTDCLILGDDGKVHGTGDFFGISHDSDGYLCVWNQERGEVFQSYRFDNERDACIKFLEMTDYDYHLAQYIPDFKKMKRVREWVER